MEFKRIALSGAQGTGKSTVLKHIELEKDAIFNQPIALIKEVVRTLAIEKGISINKVSDHDSQLMILESHYKNALSISSFITDRSAVDAFVYATFNYIQGGFSRKQHFEHKQLFEACLPHYTHHFYTPVEFKVVDDGFRDVDESYRTNIDTLFQRIFCSYGVKYVTLTGSVEERVEIFKQGIQS